MDDGLHTRMALGTANFGSKLATADCFAVLDAWVERGGQWIDTADCYAYWSSPDGHGGQSEAVIGAWLAANPGARSHIKLSTKVGAEPIRPGAGLDETEGLSAAVINSGMQKSLERLSTDYVDMYWAHKDDRSVDQAETVESFGRLVATGTARQWGYSNTPLWRVERARGIAAAAGAAEPMGLQLRYTYLQPRPLVRDNAHDHRFGWITDDVLDYAETNGVALWAYSPLLSGAYDRSDRAIQSAFEHPGTERRLLALDSMARKLGVSRTAVVARWFGSTTPRVTPIIGVSTIEQLDTAVRATRAALDEQDVATLNDPW